jgi:nucleotide-binding universal stress UspA family protein
MYRRILVPLDGSALAEVALNQLLPVASPDRVEAVGSARRVMRAATLLK